MHNHPTSAEVYERVREQHPSISRATVYRNLAVLVESGEIERVKDAWRRRPTTTFAKTRTSTACAAYAVPCAILIFLPMPTCSARWMPTAFKVEECSVVFTGLCSACAAASYDADSMNNQ